LLVVLERRANGVRPQQYFALTRAFRKLGSTDIEVADEDLGRSAAAMVYRQNTS
jgi:hypothetical protein